ncbi:hypothetical protein GCM10010873_05780 [Cypionkella aquatica]|uniref:DUF2793 domain-containing protein n=1 Tax=Cypionkella aquatica TaxID=1756042 RepID=A0AA37TTP2_9RHOB|nr:DUF2793 domain-containing protein [Cypionkella aquatica]GLS85605.1 hypothetical protein GCM10010873_05780 [Cypionkella aquatica]
MPDTSTILSLPLIQPAQAQKHVTHNEALRLLDLMVQLAVQSRAVTDPPVSPSLGDRYIVPVGASGVWAGQAGKIAVFETGVWQFITPLAGWQAYVLAEAGMVSFNGAAWVGLAEGPLGVAQLGVSATADATNRLVVSSAASLFDHAGAGHLMKLNKATAADTASLAFQTGYSSRALLGTQGSDDLALKVSADGSGFLDAVTVAAATGYVALPQGMLANGFSLRDTSDPSKRATFSVASVSTGTTRSYTLPNGSTELAGLSLTQTFTGSKTFSGSFTISGAVASLGTSTANSTYSVGGGATSSGNTSTVNLGTGGVSGSTTVVNIGSAVAGALGAVVINAPTVTFAASVTGIAAPNATVTADALGLGGATPDATNRLSVNAAATLLNHAGAGHQLKLNKAAAAQTASLTFQTGFSGRAEMGTTGSDDFAIKVSPDGSSFYTALTVARATGQVSLPQVLNLGGQAADPVSPANGMVWLNTTSGQIKLRSAGVSHVIGAGGGVSDGDKGDVIVSGAGAVWALNPASKYGVQVALNQQSFVN